MPVQLPGQYGQRSLWQRQMQSPYLSVRFDQAGAD